MKAGSGRSPSLPLHPGPVPESSPGGARAGEPHADGRRHVRRLLLAMLASLLFHLLLAGGLATTTLGTLAGPAREPAALEAVLKPKVAADFPLQVSRSNGGPAAHERPQDIELRSRSAKAARKIQPPRRDDRSISRRDPLEPTEKPAEKPTARIAAAEPMRRQRSPSESQLEAPARVERKSLAEGPDRPQPAGRAELSAIPPAPAAPAATPTGPLRPRDSVRPAPAEPAAASSASRQPQEVAVLMKPRPTLDPAQLPAVRSRSAEPAIVPPSARPLERSSAAAVAGLPTAVPAADPTAGAPVPTTADASRGPQAPLPSARPATERQRPQSIRRQELGGSEPDAMAAAIAGAGPSRRPSAARASEGVFVPATPAAAARVAALGEAGPGDAATAAGGSDAAGVAVPMIDIAAAAGPLDGRADTSGPAAPQPAAGASPAFGADGPAAAITGGAQATTFAGGPSTDDPAPPRAGSLPIVDALAAQFAGRAGSRAGGLPNGVDATQQPLPSPGRPAVAANTGPMADDLSAVADPLPAGGGAPPGAGDEAVPLAPIPMPIGPGSFGPRSFAAGTVGRPAAGLGQEAGEDGLSSEAATTAADPLAAGLPGNAGLWRNRDDDGTTAPPAPVAAALPRVAAVVLPVEGRVREIAKPFESRSKQKRLPSDREKIPAAAETVVDRGLDYLARVQQADGRWSLGGSPGGAAAEMPKLRSDTAATGLALLSFLGAGYDHFDGPHRDTIRRGLEFLLAAQKPDGDLYIPSDKLSDSCAWLYSHGIATMALCEAVGMTGDAIVKPAAGKACGFIVASQHPDRGGWRYTPRSDADLSVSGWMLVALRSGQLAGIPVEGRPLDGVRRLLDASGPSPASAGDAAGGPVYLYNARKPDQRPSKSSSACMTALGTLMRMHTGWSRSDPRVIEAGRTLAAATPAYGTREQKVRDCYLWYYASQVLVHTGGDEWERWYRALCNELAARQETAGASRGSWDPLGAVPDRWGQYGGRLYVTTLHLLALEVPYRHLPTYSLESP